MLAVVLCTRFFRALRCSHNSLVGVLDRVTANASPVDALVVALGEDEENEGQKNHQSLFSCQRRGGACSMTFAVSKLTPYVG